MYISGKQSANWLQNMGEARIGSEIVSLTQTPLNIIIPLNLSSSSPM